MSAPAPYPPYIFLPETRHAFLFAHQDDELPYVGVNRRCGPHTRMFWLTNGDGLAPEVKEDPKTYAAKRIAECRNAVRAMGRDPAIMTEAAHSEIAIYDRFVELGGRFAKVRPDGREGAFREFDDLTDVFVGYAEEVLEFIRAAEPDVVWTLMFQGGHPEHDLTHLLTAHALMRYERERDRKILFAQLPEYELTILVALRFPPWYRGVRHEMILTPEDLQAKRSVIDAYPSQIDLFQKFEKVILWSNKARGIFGRPATTDDYLGREFFGPVPATLNYLRSPHRFAPADYVFEAHNGTRIVYETMLTPIAERLRRWAAA